MTEQWCEPVRTGVVLRLGLESVRGRSGRAWLGLWGGRGGWLRTPLGPSGGKSGVVAARPDAGDMPGGGTVIWSAPGDGVMARLGSPGGGAAAGSCAGTGRREAWDCARWADAGCGAVTGAGDGVKG